MKLLVLVLFVAFAGPCFGAESIEAWETLKKENAAFREKARRVREAAKAKAGVMRDFEARWYETMFDETADPHQLVKVERRPRAVLGAEFDAVWEDFQKEREKFGPRIKALVEQAVSQQAQRVAKLIRNAGKAEEFEAEMAKMEELLRWPYPDPSKSQITVADELKEHRRLLEEGVSLFKAKGDVSAMGAALGKLKRMRPRSDVIKQAIEERMEQHAGVMGEGAKKAVAEFLELVRKDESAEKIREGARRLAEAERMWRELGKREEGGTDEMTKVRVQGSEWSRAREREEKGELDGAKWMYENLAKEGPQTEIGRMAAEKVRQIERKATTMREEVIGTRDAAVTDWLNGVKDAATADAARAKIEEFKDARYDEVARRLRDVSEAWKHPETIQMFRVRPAQSTPLIPCGEPLLRVYERVRRHVSARRIPEPELEKAPLSEQALEEAFGVLEKRYRMEGNWAKLHELLRVRAYGQSTAEAVAIQSYLTAQRFEQANDLREAVARYRAVLEVESERTPHLEAAERLKVLREKHPEVFETPSQKPN